ncbi:MAG: aldo/keto reductase [Clostridia bacterium]|nr:aldo/keto reductase [Clostridia bacterium]
MSDLPKRILTGRLPPVSRLAFGSLTVGPLQADLPTERAGEVLSYAFDRGINFLDTAQYYRNYEHIRAGLKKCRHPEEVMISSKTYAYDEAGALAAVDEARRALDRDVIDLFMLHEQESIHTLRGHREALDTLFSLREQGVIRAVGISTHHIAAVEGAMVLAEEGTPLDVVHPLFNKAGIGIADGTAEQMAEALARLHETGCGIFGMKALAGGHLYRDAADALAFVAEKPFMDAVAIGMQDESEVDANIAFFTEGAFPASAVQTGKLTRRLHVEEYCEGCGNCAARCGQNAITLVQTDSVDDSPYDFGAAFAAAEGIGTDSVSVQKTMASVDSDKCVLCGYCTAVCPLFALKVY